MVDTTAGRRVSDATPAFFKRMPKIELHAHLNGSVSQDTLKSLVNSQAPEKKSLLEAYRTSINHGEQATLEECFGMFKLVQQIVNTKESLYVATCDVIREFAEDGVVYLELRSTPRPDASTGLTKRIYLETILRAVRDCSSDPGDDLGPTVMSSATDSISGTGSAKQPIIVRLIVSIDRRGTVAEAVDTVQLASEFRIASNGLVVGLDLSGDGTVNDARTFLPVLQEGRRLGLKLTVHAAEVPGKAEETAAILQLVPDRIGHGTFIHPDFGGNVDLFEAARTHSIPLELCLASNIKSEVHPSYCDHHFKAWYELGHPVCICTDDKGVFATSQSEEYTVASLTFGLRPPELWELTKKSLQFVFAEDLVVTALSRHISQWESCNKSEIL